MHMTLLAEIQSQPQVLAEILETQRSQVDSVAGAIGARRIRLIYLAGRGSSDHAGLYAKYLFGALNRLPLAMAAPSLFSIYQQPPRLDDSLVMGISQSGQSPDIISVVEEGRRQGAMSLAITNDRSSPLAQAAEFVIEMGAGREQAVAATKTYTAQLLILAMLSAMLQADQERLAALEAIPSMLRAWLPIWADLGNIMPRLADLDRCVVLGRGYNYASAYEWAIKLKEMALVDAAPYSSADFQHGPIVMLDAALPILTVTPAGMVSPGIVPFLAELVRKQNARLVAITNHPELLQLASVAIRLPEELPEWLSPIVSIVPAQLFAYYLARVRGIDPEKPRSLQKVTRTE